MGTTASKDEDDVNFTPKVSSVKDTKGDKSSRNKSSARNGDLPHKESSGYSEKLTGVPSMTNTCPSHEADEGQSGNTANTASTAVSSTDRPGSAGGTSHIMDEDVNVNLAMADLMAYLQVVANNSQNLPLTRRDDPELGRTVSTLTAEEYAKKSAAFIPSDVCVIGGSFTKYGRVWDLPTTEDYSISDGAQEPGRSTGGACSNALLKVLYDTENEAPDVSAMSEFVNPDNLFEDDDDETANHDPAGIPSKSFDMSLPDMTQMSTITWADLLRKMKLEMQSVGYPQTPTITSSRKFDLNKPFALVPPGFDSRKNKKRSLLIGCNYTNVPGAEIKACHDDIRSVKDFIVNIHGFPETKGLMTVLLDDGEHKPPTHMNITEAFKALSEQSQPGDAVFVQFSGHGGRVLDSRMTSEGESYDEIIIPSDHSESGVIRDTLVFKTLLAPMRHGVTVTCIIDCCDTGMMLDLPYSWTTRTEKADSSAKMSLNDDFSFVRFLKVIKTLYESSTFTQLGKTVGTALMGDKDGGSTVADDDTLGVGSLITVDDEEGAKGSRKGGNILTNALASCYSPNMDEGRKRSVGENGERTRERSSLLEKVMTCTLAHDDEGFLSDDETYNRLRSTDDETLGNTFDQYDSMTFDDETFDDESHQKSPRHRERERDRGRSRTRRR